MVRLVISVLFIVSFLGIELRAQDNEKVWKAAEEAVKVRETLGMP